MESTRNHDSVPATELIPAPLYRIFNDSNLPTQTEVYIACTAQCTTQEESYTRRRYAQRDWGGMLPDENAITSLEARWAYKHNYPMTREAVRASICANIPKHEHQAALEAADKELGGTGSGACLTPIKFLRKNIPSDVLLVTYALPRTDEEAVRILEESEDGLRHILIEDWDLQLGGVGNGILLRSALGSRVTNAQLIHDFADVSRVPSKDTLEGKRAELLSTYSNQILRSDPNMKGMPVSQEIAARILTVYADLSHYLPNDEAIEYMAKAYTPYPLLLGGVPGFRAYHDNVAHVIAAEESERANRES